MKFKMMVMVLMMSVGFILMGCQSAPDEPIDVVIVGNEVGVEQKITDITKWEYLELVIDCFDFVDPPCSMLFVDKKYYSRVEVLNEYGELGWEVISTEASSNMYFLLKRPVTP